MPNLYPGVIAPEFTPGQFTDYAGAGIYNPTSDYRAVGKARFANRICKFILAGCPKSQFTSRLYTRLSNCFGHIAHDNANGFYNTWFSTPSQRVDFLSNILHAPCHGKPMYTYSDAENAVKAWVKDSGIYQVAGDVYTKDHRKRQMQAALSILNSMNSADKAVVLAVLKK